MSPAVRERHRADAVTGPCLPRFEIPPAAWIERGGFSGARLRALTRIEIDGDTLICVPEQDGVVDTDLMADDDHARFDFVLDKEKAALHGVATAEVVRTLRLALARGTSGATAPNSAVSFPRGAASERNCLRFPPCRRA